MAEVTPARSPVTIRDVARAANVHISTVSRALDPDKSSLVSPATRARIVAVAEELGYRPHLIASGLRRGQTRTIGVVVPDLDNPLYAPFAHGVAHALEGGGYMPLVADTQDDHERLERILEHLVGRRVDGVITTAARMADEAALVRLAREGMPVVLAVRTLPHSGLPAVLHDDVGGGRLAATHLLDLGHTALAQVQGPLDVEPFRARTRGFLEAVRERGAEVVVEVEPAARPTIADGERVMNALLDAADVPPTGLFVQNDTLALGALKAMRDRGVRCPEDLSLVGYNDAFFAAHACPPLTTIRLPGFEIGRLAGAMVIELIENADEERAPRVVPAALVTRESTARPSPRR